MQFNAQLDKNSPKAQLKNPYQVPKLPHSNLRQIDDELYNILRQEKPN